MRTKFFSKITMIITFLAMLLTACGGSKDSQTGQSPATQKKIQELQDEAALIAAQAKLDAAKREALLMDLPCFQPDDDDWYTGTIARRRPANATNTLATACLRAARQNLQQKIKGTLKQVTREYFDQMDIDEGSTEASHIESASDYIVNQFMNDMQETCRKITLPDEQGMITMYMGVKISKKELVDNLTTGLSKDKKLETRFNEQKFREEAFKVFSEDRQQSFDNFTDSE